MTPHRWFIIRVLAGIALLVAARGPAPSQAPSAADVLLRFCQLDAQGEQLTRDGWQKVAALFATPGAPRRDKIIVVAGCVVSLPSPEKAKVGFYVEYVELGRIDLSKVRFSSPLPPGIKVRAGFYVTKQPGAGSAGAAEWRIEGPVPEPHVTVDTAIRYATELRANARDVAMRKSADRVLAALKRLR